MPEVHTEVHSQVQGALAAKEVEAEVQQQPQVEFHALATLLQLGRRAREARDDAELAFIAVNETHALATYRQAVLWLNTSGVAALSGVVSPEANAPYVQWLRRLFPHLNKHINGRAALQIQAEHLSVEMRPEWPEWLPEFGVCLPLPAQGRYFKGGTLLLARDQPWSEAELALLSEWAAVWTQARALMYGGSWLRRAWRRLSGQAQVAPAHSGGAGGWAGITGVFFSKSLWFIGLLTGAMFIPVHLTVLAPAELVPLHPSVIRAPLDGVVDRVLVTPNQAVQADDALFEFDRANIQNRLQIALRALGTVQAEYRQKSQQALFDPVSKAQLGVLQSQIAEKNTEVIYLQKLNERGVVVAPRAGIVLFDAPTEWVGRPVVTGERVMVVADEHAVEIEAWLAPADAIPLLDGAKVSLFLNADPLTPVPAKLTYIGHEAIERPGGHYAYRVRASLDSDTARPRVGLKGTAKLQGEQVTLGYWIMRRPLAATRAWLGL